MSSMQQTTKYISARQKSGTQIRSGNATRIMHRAYRTGTAYILHMLPKRTSSARLASLLSSGVSARDTKPVSPPTRRQRSADSVTYY